MNTLQTARRRVTHSIGRKAQVRKSAPPVQSEADRRRDALAFNLTLRLSGLSDKNGAAALERDRTTVNRWRNGQSPTPAARFRPFLRKLVHGGTFPVAILADAAAEMWSVTLGGMDHQELDARRRELHRAETAVQARVDVWQQDDAGGLSPECEDAVDEAILEHATRLIELYALRHEARLRPEGAL